MLCSIAEALVDRTARTVPSYARVPLEETLAKESWTEADYDLLYHQTGLSKPALDAIGDRSALHEFQDALFYKGEIKHLMASFTTPHDVFLDPAFCAPIAPLEDGDVLVSSSCHTFGWRNGHAAIVIDEKNGTILESVAPGTLSGAGSTLWFRMSTNFLVLRLKDTPKEQRAEIARVAKERLTNVPYSLFPGIFFPKDQGETPKRTHCSHLVWQAFEYFGYDIDSDGGPVCTSNDIARCSAFEVIQVFGFDPDQLW